LKNISSVRGLVLEASYVKDSKYTKYHDKRSQNEK
jgi:hypothetical protein